jgi:hypothetical protein
MEQNLEIKNAVKQKVIEFMAEQITKESGFAELKNEIVTEMFYKKEIEAPVVSNEKTELKPETTTFPTVGINPIDEKNKKMAELWEKIKNWKSGGFPKNLIDAHSTKKNTSLEEAYEDILKNMASDGYVYKPEYFQDYLLKTSFTESQKTLFRENVLKALREREFTTSIVKTVINNKISRVIYKAENNSNKNNIDEITGKYKILKINIFSNILTETKNLVIDTACIELDGMIMMNEDVGLETLSEVINIIEAKVNSEKNLTLKTETP